jgi:hypothetical protein
VDRQAELKQRIQLRTHKSKPSQSSTEIMNSALRFWQDALLFLPIIYAIIYLIGLFYHMGYLDGFRLEPDEFPLSTDLTLLQGAYSLISMSLPHFGYALTLFVIFFLLMAFLVFARRAREKITKFFNTLSPPHPKNQRKKILAKAKVTTRLIDTSAVLYARLTVLLVQLGLVLFLGVISMQSGTAAAEKDKKNLYQQTHPKTEIISPMMTAPPYLRVICNVTHCAYWNKAGTTILRHDQVEQTFLPPKKPKKS